MERKDVLLKPINPQFFDGEFVACDGFDFYDNNSGRKLKNSEVNKLYGSGDESKSKVNS
ncbi:MAG: hypothetical protein KAS32_16500 [Candidatus Peribacteraceae bacterium]|nr:hypothetical protein [Candidatus Peribacteraceae bacterium]